MYYVLTKFGIHHVSLNVCKKYVPLVFHLDIVVIMLLIHDYICYIVLCVTCHPKDPGVLCHDNMWSFTLIPQLWRNMLPSLSGLR